MKHIRSAAANSEFYRDLYNGIDLGRSFEEVYPQLPVIGKNEVKENVARIVTQPTYLLKKGHTSGTSGSPLSVYRSVSSILKENAYVWYYRMLMDLQPGDAVVSMRGVLDNSTLHYINKSENTLYLSSYNLSRNNINKYAELIMDFKPKAIIAFPSSLYTMINLFEEAGYNIHVPLLFTSSETVYPFQRERIENGFSGKIFDRFGNAERTISLIQCECGNYHAQPMYGLVEFTQKGACTTSLINKAFPLIKYMIDDTFKPMTDNCACGRGPGIHTIEGRVDDVVILPDGTRVGRLGVAFQGIPNLKYAQIVQEELSNINVNLVTLRPFSKDHQDLLLSKLRQRLNPSLNISFRQVDETEIIKSRSGKYKLVISKL